MSNLEANRLELRSDLAELKRLAGWLKAQAQQDLSADTSFAIQLCLEEAVANIIMHGGGAKDDRLRIAIELERDGGTLVASIEDSGQEFDPTHCGIALNTGCRSGLSWASCRFRTVRAVR
jgi:anti-sigma regulatory factor (Ser/Thr protein kinase)